MNAYTQEKGYTPWSNPVVQMFEDSAAAARGQGTYEENRARRAGSPQPASPTASPSPVAPSPISPVYSNEVRGRDPNTVQNATSITNQPFSSRTGNSFTERNTVEDKRNPLSTIDMAGNNARALRANAIRQSMTDGYGTGPKVTFLRDSDPHDGHKVLERWGREREMSLAGPRKAQALAAWYNGQDAAETNRSMNQLNNETSQRGQDTRLQEMGMQGDVTVRGQDVNAKSEADRLAGNPLVNKAMKQNLDSGDIDLKQKNTLAMLHDEYINATTDEKKQLAIQKINALSGKNQKPEEYDNLVLDVMDQNGIKTGQRVQQMPKNRAVQQNLGIEADPKAIAIRDNAKLSMYEKKKQLAALGY